MVYEPKTTNPFQREARDMSPFVKDADIRAAPTTHNFGPKGTNKYDAREEAAQFAESFAFDAPVVEPDPDAEVPSGKEKMPPFIPNFHPSRAEYTPPMI